jgi:endonuclease/exonuclease/phosphatase (EEP) superfamily protein YafD
VHLNDGHNGAVASGPLLLGATRPWPALARRVAAMVGGAGIVTGLVVLAVRQVGWTNRTGMVISTMTPYLVAAPLAGTAAAAAGRQKALTAAGLATLVLFGASQLPLYVGGPGVDGPSVPLRVLTSNMRFGFADADQLVREVRDSDVDVLALQELTPEAVERLTASGIRDLLPYELLRPEWGVGGAGLYSRFPLEGVAVPVEFGHAPVVATTTVVRDGARIPMTIASVHPRAPWPHSTPEWSDELLRMATWADGIAGAVVLAGDFNATNDHDQMRRFYDHGYIDGAARAGGGYLATYPSDRGYPPLIAIDHVLTRGGPVTTKIKSLTISGTDHRAVLATVAVPF